MANAFDRSRRLIALLFLLVAGLTGKVAAAPPTPFELQFEVLRNGSALGEAKLSLRQLGDKDWQFISHTRGTRGLAALAGADILEQSTFHWREGLPELGRYEFRQDVAFKSRKRSLSFTGDGAIDSRDGKRRHQLQFQPGVMDRNVVILALGADLARADAGELQYLVADRDSIEWHRYRNAGDETVAVPAGSFQTTRVDRIREKPGRTTTSWLAPQLGYLPVRILQTEADGETIEMRLQRRP